MGLTNRNAVRVPSTRCWHVICESARPAGAHALRRRTTASCLAGAWACEPALLFADEPTANLAPVSARAIEQLLLRLHGNGTTLVMTTHNVALQARRMATRIIFVDGGRVVEDRSVDEFLIARSPPRRVLILKEKHCELPHELITSPKFRVQRAMFGALASAALAALSGLMPASAAAQDTSIVVSSTTSTEQSGLFGFCCRSSPNPAASPSRWLHWDGQALDVGVEAMPMWCSCMTKRLRRNSSQKVLALNAWRSMYNDFVLVGPPMTPPRQLARDIVAGLKAVHAAKAAFVSAWRQEWHPCR